MVDVVILEVSLSDVLVMFMNPVFTSNLKCIGWKEKDKTKQKRVNSDWNLVC